MASHNTGPFPRGSTFGTTSTSDGVQHEGQRFTFEDLDYSSTSIVKPRRSARMVECMICRNVAAAAILPKRIVTFATTSGATYLGRVDGYARLTAARIAGVVDEFLPTAGCAVNDLCYVVIDGPTMVLTPLEADANNVFAVGTVLVALTGITSGATTAGRPAPQDLTGATALLGDQIQNRLGQALSAKTTANTNVDILIDVKRW